MNWSVTAPTFVDRWKKGFARAGKAQPGKPQPYIIQYLKSGPIADIEEGRAIVEGRNADGSVIAYYEEPGAKAPPTQWNMRSHNAEHYGTKTLRALLPARKFPFPKSVYAVEDVLRLFVAEKPEAIILDFFSGSGTTANAVMRLNRQDGGLRQCISVTNNEVAAIEQEELRKKGLRPGDAEWEKWGICDYITKPRVGAAISGKTPDGEPIKGDYKFNDKFPMAEGFEENAEFFTLTYETPVAVSHHMAFARIAPMLWLRAGSRGRCIVKIPARG
jgi:adenine-specific DNA-methyltransferase